MAQTRKLAKSVRMHASEKKDDVLNLTVHCKKEYFLVA